MKRNNKKGFTIVELVIVIAVIGVLAGVLIPTFAGIITSANESKALQQARAELTKIQAADLAEDGDYDNGNGVTYDDEGNVTEFIYTGAEGYKVTFDGSEWKVEKTNP